jgi:hypothetical protein
MTPQTALGGRRHTGGPALVALLLLFIPVLCQGQTKRVVTIQCDGLPYDLVDRFVRERDPRTGKVSCRGSTTSSINAARASLIFTSAA